MIMLKKKRAYATRRILNNLDLYALLIIPTLFIFVFKYVPIYGIQIAFRDYSIFKGMLDSPFVGLKHFGEFFHSSDFNRLIGNTLTLSLYGLVSGVVFSVVLALMLNYLLWGRLRKMVQMVTYAPYFISTIVMVSIVLQFLAFDYGPVNTIIRSFGLPQIDFLSSPGKFPHIYVWSGIWQYTGYSSIIYIAALSGIDPALHEAAVMDGASKIQRIWYIDLPGLLPTITILMILSMGGILTTGFEKVYLMQNALNLRTSEVIDTFVYKVGLASPIANYSFPTAVGLFQSIIGLLLTVAANAVSKKVGESSLW